jgi:hypothetical protein
MGFTEMLSINLQPLYAAHARGVQVYFGSVT